MTEQGAGLGADRCASMLHPYNEQGPANQTVAVRESCSSLSNGCVSGQ